MMYLKTKQQQSGSVASRSIPQSASHSPMSVGRYWCCLMTRSFWSSGPYHIPQTLIRLCPSMWAYSSFINHTMNLHRKLIGVLLGFYYARGTRASLIAANEEGGSWWWALGERIEQRWYSAFHFCLFQCSQMWRQRTNKGWKEICHQNRIILSRMRLCFFPFSPAQLTSVLLYQWHALGTAWGEE